jgi:hypothetical protein
LNFSIPFGFAQDLLRAGDHSARWRILFMLNSKFAKLFAMLLLVFATTGAYAIEKDELFLNTLVFDCKVETVHGHFTHYKPPEKSDTTTFKFSDLLIMKDKFIFTRGLNTGPLIPLDGPFKIKRIHHLSDKNEISCVRLVSDHRDKIIMDIELFHQKGECKIWIVYEINEGLIQGVAVLKGKFKSEK